MVLCEGHNSKDDQLTELDITRPLTFLDPIACA